MTTVNRGNELYPWSQCPCLEGGIVYFPPLVGGDPPPHRSLLGATPPMRMKALRMMSECTIQTQGLEI